MTTKWLCDDSLFNSARHQKMTINSQNRTLPNRIPSKLKVRYSLILRPMAIKHFESVCIESFSYWFWPLKMTETFKIAALIWPNSSKFTDKFWLISCLVFLEKCYIDLEIKFRRQKLFAKCFSTKIFCSRQKSSFYKTVETVCNT